ncbi:MAG: VCBS repeat-containing protein, partial [Ginsengibacter sp.]
MKITGGIIGLLFLFGCKSPHTLFQKLSSSQTGIDFNNRIIENDSINPLDLEFLYNGGGVAVGDFNNDGLPDLYFTASTASNKLYLNKGNLQFKDITAIAGVGGEGEWCNSASVVDINNDGLEDIYVCTTIKSNPRQRKNLLYINQGLNKDGVPVFKEMAAEYGLADTSWSVHAAFFDYDNDGDLDMYLVTTKLAKRESFSFNANTIKNSDEDVDKLYRNDWDSVLNHPVFTNVSKQAGINEHGFGLGIAIVDINNDGWKDVYVTNDFYGSDHLYINNHNGTFTDKVKQYFKHTSQNAMGNDIADINNDGLPDVFAVDMNPEDNYRKQKNMGGNNSFIEQNMLNEGLELQYVRNTLQLNLGNVVAENDSISNPVFADIAFYSGVAQTDWSWNPSLADFDNDGFKDLIITNGYPRDVTDHDFAAYRSNASAHVSKKEIIEQIPKIKVPNYAYKNLGNLKFEDVTKQWGMNDPSFSNGAVYVDLDNDGDLDYVVNNINDKAFVYENTTNSKNKINKNYLEIQFNGGNKNLFGLGAIATIYYDHGKMQTYENSPYRGYLSTVDTKAFFGLNKVAIVDSVVIEWTNRRQVLYSVKANQLLKVNINNANLPARYTQPNAQRALFTNITTKSKINYTHQETNFVDFNNERLLPHKLSQYGPGLAVADVDGNGLDDIFIGGTGDYNGQFLLQQPDGTFRSKELNFVSNDEIRKPENMGLLLFDADGDGDEDLYCVSGSNESPPLTRNYQDQFFVNNGKGNFTIDTAALPINFTSKSCIKATDIDNDGDLDLFIGGRVLPGKYPLPVSSFIYRNDSKPGKIKFTDITNEVAPGLKNIGLVSDAIWTDFDNDGWMDLIVVGEWMPPTFFKNEHGKLVNVTTSTGLQKETGWWNSIVAGDFDNDGDIDYIVGNLGENSFFQASTQFPVNTYADDFDKNGTIDDITTVFLKDKAGGERKEFSAFNRDDIISQLPLLKKKFLTYKEFAREDIHGIFSADELADALHLQATNFKSCYIENLGNGKFKMHPLPAMAQMAPVFGMIVDDFNNDGNLDVLLCGNDFGNEVRDGRYDAMNGLLLLGDGKGNFVPQTILKSGIYIPGNAKAL